MFAAGKMEDSYEIVRKLGEGGNAEVCLATHKVGGYKRAIKIMPKRFGTKMEKECLENEIEILRKVSHPNIIHFRECFDGCSSISLVTDIYEGGELFDEIIRRKTFSEADAALIVRQLLSCVAYLAENNIVHRDIKPENIMLENPKDLSSIKLIDFGHAINYNPSSDGFLTETLGTPYYVAPEVLCGKYDNKCDIWAIGVISFLLLSGYPPFNGKNQEIIFKKIVRGKFSMETDAWSKVSYRAKDFVDTLLTYDYSLRPEAKDALAMGIMKIEKPVRPRKVARLNARCKPSLASTSSQCLVDI